MKTAFLTETQFKGKWPMSFPNKRTEIAWQLTLESDHFNIHDYESVKGYDAVFIIFPKGMVRLNTIGLEMTTNMPAHDMSIYKTPIVSVLKDNNKKVCNVQEGPSWFFNEYDLDTQFHFYNHLSECDVLFAHNASDVKFYQGLFPSSKVTVMPSLMIDPSIPSSPKKDAIIGGNFARWYGGFQSYMVANNFNCNIFVPASHCKRRGEEQVPNLTHLPWVDWTQWMTRLSSFKYAVNLMPTVAAGTFQMNCAYFGIPCIGNSEVDTQNLLFPLTSVNITDVVSANQIAQGLLLDDFYNQVKGDCKERLHQSWHLDRSKWLEHVQGALNV